MCLLVLRSVLVDIPLIFVFYFCLQQNRPLNSQNVADFLQKFNLKKAAVQKALDTLADSGKISFKEYGKQKIYIARQDQFDIPNSEELNQMKEENSKLQEELGEVRKAISEVEGGIFPQAKILIMYLLELQYHFISVFFHFRFFAFKFSMHSINL